MLADLAARLAELDGVDPPASPDSDTTSTRLAELVAGLVEPAKVTALETLGDGERALGIAADWLRSRMEPSGFPPSGDSACPEAPTP